MVTGLIYNEIFTRIKKKKKKKKKKLLAYIKQVLFRQEKKLKLKTTKASQGNTAHYPNNQFAYNDIIQIKKKLTYMQNSFSNINSNDNNDN